MSESGNDDDSRRAAGLQMVERLFAGASSGVQLPRQLRDYTIRHVFGDLWQSDGLSVEERSLVTCSMLVAMNREHEQRLHFQAARNLGLPRAKIEAMITHAAHYAGWPCAVTAAQVLAEVWPETE